MQECKLNNIMVQFDCLIDNKNMILNALSVDLPYQDNSWIMFKKLSTLYVYWCLHTDPYVIEDNGVLHTLTTVWYYMIDNISQQHLDYRTSGSPDRLNKIKQWNTRKYDDDCKPISIAYDPTLTDKKTE